MWSENQIKEVGIELQIPTLKLLNELEVKYPVKLNAERKKELMIKRRDVFKNTLQKYISIYPIELLKDFYLYWGEPNKSQTKFRQELEKTWDLSRRLEKWSQNDFNKSKPTQSKLESMVNSAKEALNILNNQK